MEAAGNLKSKTQSKGEKDSLPAISLGLPPVPGLPEGICASDTSDEGGARAYSVLGRGWLAHVSTALGLEERCTLYTPYSVPMQQ